MEATSVMKLLSFTMLLSVAVQADTVLPPYLPPQPQGYVFPAPSPSIDAPAPSPSIDAPEPSSSIDAPVPSPSIDSPPPPSVPETSQPPPSVLPQAPPPPTPGDDPIPPPPLNCNIKCAMKCAEKSGFSRLICYALCLAKCKILPFDHVNYHCTQDCILSNIHHQPNTKNLDGLISGCYSVCAQDS